MPASQSVATQCPDVKIPGSLAWMLGDKHCIGRLVEFDEQVVLLFAAFVFGCEDLAVRGLAETASS